MCILALVTTHRWVGARCAAAGWRLGALRLCLWQRPRAACLWPAAAAARTAQRAAARGVRLPVRPSGQHAQHDTSVQHAYERSTSVPTRMYNARRVHAPATARSKVYRVLYSGLSASTTEFPSSAGERHLRRPRQSHRRAGTDVHIGKASSRQRAAARAFGSEPPTESARATQSRYSVTPSVPSSHAGTTVLIVVFRDLGAGDGAATGVS